MSSSVKKQKHLSTPSGVREGGGFIPLSSAISARRRMDLSPAGFPRTPRPLASGVVQVNDDEAERRQRRLQSNMCTMLSPGCHTPKGTAGSDQTRVIESSSTSSLSNSQLTEHYANCIKLSSQNKISSKNAFGLHLIDHMLRLLKMRGEISNFQIASSTLDASAKIYAGRVDSMYNDAYKVLGGLGREHHGANGEEEEGGEEGKEAGNEEGEGKKRGKKHKKSSTIPGLMIEKDPSVLDLADFDLESRVDPLFKKTAAAFDEGGVGGLLLNNINVQDDNCSLTLDASQMPVTSDQPCEGTIVHIEEGLFDLAALQSRQICPTFANFKFNSTDTEGLWNFPSLSSGEVGGTGRDGGVDRDSADFTMLDCPPTAPDFGDDGDDDGFGNTPAMDANDDLTATRGDITALGVCSDNQVAQFVPAAGAESEKTSASVPPGMGDLCLTDLIVPSDYSYFTPAVIASWAGPQHWKLRPRNTTVKKTNETEAKPKKRKGSTSFKVNFTNKPDKSLFAKSKGSTQLSKATLAKLDTSQTTLPRDPHTDVDVLHRLFCRPKWKIRRQKKQAGIVDEGLEGDWYDYSNDNDQLNYCAPANDGDDSDVPLDEPGFSQGFFDQTQPDVPSQPTGTTTDGTELGGDNLVAQPHKVNQVLINYARSAKKVDVKKLKGKMWEVISREPQEEETDSSSDGGGVNFSSMYSKLPSIVSSAMARNISVPICFVCLLHLANEKKLVLSSTSDLSDFNIAAP